MQVGHGRSGEQLWSFAAQGVAADVVTLGKPMGNGHPVAALITRRELTERFAETTEWFSTFGGNPVACAAALAVLDVIEDEGLVARAGRVGPALRAALGEVQARHETIGDVRGAGMLTGVELIRDPETKEPDPELTEAVANGMRARRRPRRDDGTRGQRAQGPPAAGVRRRAHRARRRGARRDAAGARPLTRPSPIPQLFWLQFQIWVIGADVAAAPA